MTQQRLLTISSLLSILLFSLHFADDIARGFEGGGLDTAVGILILVVWLFATLVLADRRGGLIIILLFSIGAAGVPVVHMTGAGLTGGRIAGSSGILLWVWTLVALGVTGAFSALLSARGLWRSPKASRSGLS